MNKRIFFLFIVFFTIMSIFSISNAEEMSMINININSNKLSKNQNIELTFLAEKVSKITGYLEYDASLKTSGTSSKNTVIKSDLQTGEFTYTSTNYSGINITEKFKLKENADIKSTIIRLVNMKITDYDGQEYEIKDKEFTIEFEESSQSNIEVNENKAPEENIEALNENTNILIEKDNSIPETNTNETLPKAGIDNNLLLFFIGLTIMFAIITYIKTKSID